MKKFILIPVLFFTCFAMAQSVGIGTTAPNSSSILDLGPSAKPFVLPRLTTSQMNSVATPATGMILYNTNESQLYGYMRFRTLAGQSNDRWQPISTGPRMLAWGVVDSFANEINGSNNFNINYDAALHWYVLTLEAPHQYYPDSMLLMVTPVGSGSWDQAVSTAELPGSSPKLGLIKFVDVSRLADGFSTFDARRRSGFHFTLYDLRKEPY